MSIVDEFKTYENFEKTYHTYCAIYWIDFALKRGYDYTNLYSVSWMPKTLSSVKNNTAEESLKIRDNGTEIIISVNVDDLKKVSLYSISGKLMYSKVTADNEMRIGKTQFAKGVYILNLEANGEKISRKINF